MGSVEEAAQSYAHWWREAGFHTAIDPTPHGWRQAPAAPFWQRDAAETAAPVQPVAQTPQRVTEIVALSPTAREMPGTLPAFLDWLATDEAQPEAAWDSPFIRPSALAQARLMAIVEMPSPTATDADTLLEMPQRKFVNALLASIGVTAQDAAVVSLAAKRPPGGLLDEGQLGRLAQRMGHYLGLSRPRAVIILGDRTSRALTGAQRAAGGEWLLKLNHGGGTVDAIALPGLDLLMGRPVAKARSWQALRLLGSVVKA